MEAGVQCVSGLGGKIISDLWDWDVTCSHIPLHGIRWGRMCKDLQCISHVTVSVFHLNMAVVCIFYILFFSQKEFQHLFNKSKKGCKQNALCRSRRDWRGFQKQRPDLWLWHGEYTAGTTKWCKRRLSHGSLFVISGAVIWVSGGLLHQTNPMRRWWRDAKPGLGRARTSELLFTSSRKRGPTLKRN